MATNNDLWKVADGILDAKEYRTENLSSIESVKRYGDACNIELDDHEAVHIIERCKDFLSKDDGNWSQNWEELKLSILDWDREDGEQDHPYFNESVKILNNAQWDMGPIVALMDDEIREALHYEIAPCSDLFFVERYLEKHEKKYGAKFDFS